jgi:hypothetical protein
MGRVRVRFVLFRGLILCLGVDNTTGQYAGMSIAQGAFWQGGKNLRYTLPAGEQFRFRASVSYESTATNPKDSCVDLNSLHSRDW